MSDFPVKHTFIHFCFHVPPSRSCSAPPRYASAPALQKRDQKAKKRKKRLSKRQADKDAAAFSTYRAAAVCETWVVLADKLAEKDVQSAKGQSVHVPRLRVILPDHLFKDWAWYTFPRRDSVVIAELLRSGFLRNINKLGVHFWCSDSLYNDKKTEYFRNFCANAEQILESQDKNYFSILVNSDMVVFLLYDGDALIKDIANKVRQILGIVGEPTVTHRNRPLNLSGTISSNWIRAGNKFSLDFS